MIFCIIVPNHRFPSHDIRVGFRFLCQWSRMRQAYLMMTDRVRMWLIVLFYRVSFRMSSHDAAFEEADRGGSRWLHTLFPASMIDRANAFDTFDCHLPVLCKNYRRRVCADTLGSQHTFTVQATLSILSTRPMKKAFHPSLVFISTHPDSHLSVYSDIHPVVHQRT